MDVAEHHCVKQNEPDPKRTNSACCHVESRLCVCVYMCVCVETGGRGEGDGSTCEMEMKGNCVGGVGGPARRPEGREGQRVEKHRWKQKIKIAYVYANAIRKPTCVLTLKINIKRRELNVLRHGLDCPHTVPQLPTCVAAVSVGPR